MSDISLMKQPYRAVTKENWDDLKRFFDDEAYKISFPMTVAKDTAFHIAVHSKREQPLKHLLERFECPMGDTVFTTNAYGNTVLHEAAINKNIEAVKLLVKDEFVTQQQLLKPSDSGQTPLFKAAAFGSTKVVKFLASLPNQRTCDGKLIDCHRTKTDGTSILHVAVRGEHFGTALELLKLDKGLAELTNDSGKTSLYFLTSKQTAFSTKFRHHLWHRFLYFCIPTGDDNNDDAENIDDDDRNEVQVGANDDANNIDDVGDQCDGQSDIHDQIKNAEPRFTIGKAVLNTINKTFWKKIIGVLETINKSCWKIFIGGSPTVRKIWKEKRKHKFAFKLAHLLIEKDNSWQQSFTEDTTERFEQEKPKTTVQQTSDVAGKNEEIKVHEEQEVETPLLAATRTGVLEIVKEILRIHPQAVEHISYKKQNILHVAASYRERGVFELVKQMQIPTRRLILGIDEDSYTVLHHVANTKNYTGGTRAGPAYQLQEELEWFKSVEEIMPSYFTQHHDKNGKTAKELFMECHKVQLKEAQQWIKDTSQSCSAVAVLLATVVFAAAFTVPGGTNDSNGLPILLHSPLFLFFTVSDVVSLSCSLTAVVMFLSVVTSPFELDNFRVLLPRRLTFGFALLFMSVMTTMLAFSSTIFLIIRSDQRRRWTLTLICSAAFFPVSVLALTHFPLFISFIRAWNSIFKLIWIWMAFPCKLVLRIWEFLRKKFVTTKIYLLYFQRRAKQESFAC